MGMDNPNRGILSTKWIQNVWIGLGLISTDN